MTRGPEPNRLLLDAIMVAFGFTTGTGIGMALGLRQWWWILPAAAVPLVVFLAVRTWPLLGPTGNRLTFVAIGAVLGFLLSAPVWALEPGR